MSSFKTTNERSLVKSAESINVGSGFKACSDTDSAALSYNRSMKIFDMEKFRAILACEARKPYPNKRYLQRRCITIASFVVDDKSILNLPSWVMIINIVAIDLLRAQFGFFEFGSTTLRQSRPTTDQSHLTCRLLDFDRTKPAEVTRRDEKVSRARVSQISRLVRNQRTYSGVKASSNFAEATEARAKDPSELQQVSTSSNSSSGFNSNCSSQKDSSPSGSSSNIDQNQPQLKSSETKRGCKLLNREMIGTSNPRANRMILPDHHLDSLQQSGHKGSMVKGATAKLLSATSNHAGLFANATFNPPTRQVLKPTRLSKPVPMSATPTTQSGKEANLILVSPTGLSPPLPKRKGPKNHQGQTDPYEYPEFTTIKHIDENGTCNLLLDANARIDKLPAGIPSHAKLAPPATQRHIMRFLMSSRNKLSEVEKPYGSPSSMSANQAGRPLPIVPSNSGHPRVQDETLYYRGLQARVPASRPMRRPSFEPTPMTGFKAPNMSIYRPFGYFGSNFDLNQAHSSHLLSSNLLKLNTKSKLSGDRSSQSKSSGVSNRSVSANNLNQSGQRSLLRLILPFQLVGRSKKVKNESPSS